MSAPAESCDGRCDATGKCDPKHPINCCHLMRLVYRPGPRAGAICAKGCGKETKTWTKILAGEPPAI